MPKFVVLAIYGLILALVTTVGIYLLFFWFGTDTSALDPSRDSYVMADGYRMYYRYLPATEARPEESPTLVLIHSEAWPSNAYDRLVKQLRGNTNLYVVDLLGYGKSDKPQRRYNTAYYERTLREGLQQLPSKRMSILGNSATGGIAVHIANSQPDRYNQVIWLNPLGFGEATLGLGSVLQVPILGELTGLPLSSLFTLTNQRGLLTGSALPSDHAKELFTNSYWYSTGRARLHLYRSTYTPRGISPEYSAYVEDGVRNAQVDITLIWGEDDVYANTDQATWARELNPGRIQTILIPGARHDVELINAKQLVDPIADTITR